MSKKLEIKQRRRQEAEQREAERKAAARRRNLVTAGIALVVIAAVAVLVIFQKKEDAPSSIGGTEAAAGCDEIEEFPEAEGNGEHVDEGTPVDYETTPGVYGPHWPPDAVSAPGFFTEPVEDERLVHNMEHGQIVLFYSPDASDETKEKIEDLVDQQQAETIAVPHDGLDKAFVMGAWGALQKCDEPSQPVVDAFRERFQGQGPERIPGIDAFTG